MSIRNKCSPVNDIPTSVEIARAVELTDAEARLLIVLGGYAYKTGYAWVSQQRLAADLRKSARQVKRLLRALRWKGWLVAVALSDVDPEIRKFRHDLWVSSRKNLDGRLNLYRVQRPPDIGLEQYGADDDDDPNSIPF